MKKIILTALAISFYAIYACKDKVLTKQNSLDHVEELTLEQLKDSLLKLQDERYDFQYFDIKSNEDALYFFEQNGIEDAENYIISKLLETNITKDEHHPLIEYRPRRGKKFQINKIKVLNQKWAICDFSDGLDWGHLLVRFDLNDDKSLSFKTLDQILYVSDIKP
ncbi:hydrolase [Capnocytophaga catalasegens]|uniref:Hydrolase n=1 Tax=Capnocytophaga catalasegens TaxID=1004260 RepID=A0AAV5AWE7_9FLAO|nr:hydrolase [Capnocytophaga catalasegens]GIZ15936.1 hypothetical protein RCZ03_19360 [Capnocytophaga catalasegens]GJM50000.1 hypothetical protein RCZ15_09750 [Capnocytophaga catalasegens]GJM54108.1 hypothetical protein RCZ16_24240 [Capnocytophaga catalasegens]